MIYKVKNVRNVHSFSKFIFNFLSFKVIALVFVLVYFTAGNKLLLKFRQNNCCLNPPDTIFPKS